MDAWTLIKILCIWLLLQNSHDKYLNEMWLPKDQDRWGLNSDGEICVLFLSLFPSGPNRSRNREGCAAFSVIERERLQQSTCVKWSQPISVAFITLTWGYNLIHIKDFTFLLVLHYYEQNYGSVFFCLFVVCGTDMNLKCQWNDERNIEQNRKLGTSAHVLLHLLRLACSVCFFSKERRVLVFSACQRWWRLLLL